MGERLCDAIARAERGLVDADLGGGLIKQRVARRGGGRSGGYRTVIAYRERGVKRPSGPSLKLLSLVKAKGLDAIT